MQNVRDQGTRHLVEGTLDPLVGALVLIFLGIRWKSVLGFPKILPLFSGELILGAEWYRGSLAQGNILDIL